MNVRSTEIARRPSLSWLPGMWRGICAFVYACLWYTYIHIHICICIYIYICVCVYKIDLKTSNESYERDLQKRCASALVWHSSRIAWWSWVVQIEWYNFSRGIFLLNFLYKVAIQLTFQIFHVTVLYGWTICVSVLWLYAWDGLRMCVTWLCW